MEGYFAEGPCQVVPMSAVKVSVLALRHCFNRGMWMHKPLWQVTLQTFILLGCSRLESANKKQSVGGQVAMAGRMPGRVRRWQRRRRTRQHDHLVIMAKSPQSLYFCRNFSVSFVREEKALALAQRLAEVLTTETRHSWAIAVFRVQIDGWPAEGQHPRCMWACTLA